MTRRPAVPSSPGRIFCARTAGAGPARRSHRRRGGAHRSRARVLLLGLDAKPKAIVHAHRAAAIQCWRWRRIFAVDPDVRTWSANGLFWSGNFCMALGTTFAAGGSLVLQRYFAPGESLRLMQAERVSLPLAWPHQWATLANDPAYPRGRPELPALRRRDLAAPRASHGEGELAGAAFGLRHHGDLYAQHGTSQRYTSGRRSGQSRLALAGQHHPRSSIR